MSVEAVRGSPTEKSPALALLALALWLALIGLVLLPWIAGTWKPSTRWFAFLCSSSGALWWALLLWAAHNLTFQLASICTPRRGSEPPAGRRVPVAILYTTCDDFSEDALRTCVLQRRTYEEATVYVLDDSRDESLRLRVRRTCEILGCMYISREAAIRDGLKAGNLNHALETVVREPWFLIVDADQRLPGDYLVRLTTAATLDRNLAYVQGAQVAGDSRAMNRFQRALSLDVSLFYFRDLVSRRRYGFIPLLGHGALVSRSAWEAAGGFPSVVSEDYAFAMTVVGRGYDSEYVRDVPSQEDFPVDFGGFIVRLRKYSSATADLLRGRVGNFLMSDASITERWDCLMLIAWYFTLPLMLVNTFASAYVVHRLRLDGQPYLAPVLPYLYSWMTFTVLGLLAAVAREFWNALRFYFWSIAVYASSIPVATVAFLQGLLGRARFERTPKNGDETSLALTHSLFTTAIGIVALVCSILWWSPFSPFLIAQGSAFTLFPLFGSLHRRNFRGAVARVLVYVPGAATLWALAAMWQATFF